MKYDVVVFDANNASHRISAASAPLTNNKGERVEVVFGLLRLFSAVLRTNPCKKCYIVWDGKGSRKLRQAIDPEYKVHRDKDKDDGTKERIQGMFQQIEVFKDMFGPYLPVLQAMSNKYEADDLISMIAHQCADNHKTCLVVSGDKDMLQLVNKYVSIYSPNSDKYCTLDNFRDYTKGFPGPDAYLFAKCLMGDTSDNVKGVGGVGEKTALKILEQHDWSLSDLLQSPVEAFSKSAVGQKVLSDSGRERIALNYRLVSLHGPLHVSGKAWKKIEPTCGTLNTRALKQNFAKMQFASLLAEFTRFITPFNSLEA